MISPSYLKPGSKIRIVSPAGKVDEKYVLPAVEWLTKKGYKVEVGKYVFAQYFQFAGTDEQRLSDLQTALDDAETDVILCSRGGYGSIRIIDKLNFNGFVKNPKWLVGFSDITILHTCINNLEIATIHASMPRGFFDKQFIPNENLKSLLNLLEGNKAKYEIPFSDGNKTGNVTGELVGGNLSILCSLLGTKYELNTNGKILFLEDIDEYLYHTDRMIHQLKLAGKFDNLAGLLIGNFTNMKDNDSPFGKSIREIIAEITEEFNYPVCLEFPAGHDKKNRALCFGKSWKLNVTNKVTTFSFNPK